MTLVSTTKTPPKLTLGQLLRAERFFRCLVTTHLWCYKGAAGNDRACARCGREEYAHFYTNKDFYWRKVKLRDQGTTGRNGPTVIRQGVLP